ncbi:MAG: alpha/beta fold hydrolase [Flavobacteriaceae bacterium]|nr:alpha/beta fold hydrolase [Flavobacteriaceae bacterium]MCY4268399.1 alpha/beta fold hydrolase [Flavobacteriaceae bacterium]MCY4299936.1 alpha/beta fold hydrolase [Flavobacteriaceae bacterium]
MSAIQSIPFESFRTDSGAVYSPMELHYQQFGQPIGKAPVVLIHHSLTGDSNVAGKFGWWKRIVGKKKVIDTEKYTILAFNILGNGIKGQTFTNYKDFHLGDIAHAVKLGLEKLHINQIYASIGGSIGGGLVWEMASMYPNLSKYIIPIAANWKATGWIIANTFIQDRILKNSSDPLVDARMHAMMTYRNPLSIEQRFNREFNDEKNIYQVESWLLGHGHKLASRYPWDAYVMMNYLLSSVDFTRDGRNLDEIIKSITSDIHIISIDSDQLFTHWEDVENVNILKKHNKSVVHHLIQSKHGHDAFLIEYDQIEAILKNIF